MSSRRSSRINDTTAYAWVFHRDLSIQDANGFSTLNTVHQIDPQNQTGFVTAYRHPAIMGRTLTTIDLDDVLALAALGMFITMYRQALDMNASWASMSSAGIPIGHAAAVLCEKVIAEVYPDEAFPMKVFTADTIEAFHGENITDELREAVMTSDTCKRLRTYFLGEAQNLKRDLHQIIKMRKRLKVIAQTNSLSREDESFLPEYLSRVTLTARLSYDAVTVITRDNKKTTGQNLIQYNTARNSFVAYSSDEHVRFIAGGSIQPFYCDPVEDDPTRLIWPPERVVSLNSATDNDQDFPIGSDTYVLPHPEKITIAHPDQVMPYFDEIIGAMFKRAAEFDAAIDALLADTDVGRALRINIDTFLNVEQKIANEERVSPLLDREAAGMKKIFDFLGNFPVIPMSTLRVADARQRTVINFLQSLSLNYGFPLVFSDGNTYVLNLFEYITGDTPKPISEILTLAYNFIYSQIDDDVLIENFRCNVQVDLMPQ